DDERTLVTLNNLAGAYFNDERHAEAIPLQEEVLAARVKKHGDGHAESVGAMLNLAKSCSATFRMRRAPAPLQPARDAAPPAAGPLPPLPLSIIGELAHMARAGGNPTEAIALGEQVLERRLMVVGAHHPDTLITLDHLAAAYRDAGKLDRALSLFQQAAAG